MNLSFEGQFQRLVFSVPRKSTPTVQRVFVPWQQEERATPNNEQNGDQQPNPLSVPFPGGSLHVGYSQP